MYWWRRAALATLGAMTFPAVVAIVVMLAALELLKRDPHDNESEAEDEDTGLRG